MSRMFYSFVTPGEYPEEVDCIKIWLLLRAMAASEGSLEERYEKACLGLEEKNRIKIDIAQLTDSILISISKMNFSDFLISEIPWLIADPFEAQNYIELMFTDAFGVTMQEDIAKFMLDYIDAYAHHGDPNEFQSRAEEMEYRYPKLCGMSFSDDDSGELEVFNEVLNGRFLSRLQKLENAAVYYDIPLESKGITLSESRAIRNWTAVIESLRTKIAVDDPEELERTLSQDRIEKAEELLLRSGKVGLDDICRVLNISESYAYDKELSGACVALRGVAALKRAESYIDPMESNLPLYCSLVYNTFRNIVLSEHAEKVIIISANAFFVEKWIQDKALAGIDTQFVISEGKHITQLLEIEKSNRSRQRSKTRHYAGTTAREMTYRFTELNEWLDGLAQGQKVNAEYALIFAAENIARRDEIIPRLAYAHGLPLPILAVTGWSEYSAGRSALAGLGGDRLVMDSIVQMPQNIVGAAFPRRKLLIRGTVCSFEQPRPKSIDILPYKLIRNADSTSQYITRQIPFRGAVAVPYEQMLGTVEDTIKKLYSEATFDGRRRKNGLIYEFSPELTISYRFQDIGKESETVTQAIAQFAAPAGAKKAHVGGKRPLLAQTKKRLSNPDTEAIEDWLEYGYPYATVKVNKEDIPVSEVVRSEFEKAAKDDKEKGLSIKTLVFLYREELAQDLDESEMAQLREIAHSPVGLLNINDSRLIIENAVNTEFPAHADRIGKMRLLDKCGDLAVSKGYSTHNRLKQKTTVYRSKGFEAIRAALAKKSLARSEARRAYAQIRSELNRGKPEFLGVLLRFRLGLSAGEVCGLKWADMKCSEDFGFPYLDIRRQTDKDGNIKSLDTVEEYRRIPIPPDVETEMMCVKAKYGDTSEFVVHRADNTTLTPRDIKGLCDGIITKLEILDRIFFVPDEVKGEKRTNLSVFYGDFFAANFDYWASEAAGLTNDEINYILGITPVTTYGKHYRDFRNEATLLAMYTKLKRWRPEADYKGIRTEAALYTIISDEDEMTVDIGCDRGCVITAELLEGRGERA